MPLSVAQTAQRRTVGLLINNEINRKCNDITESLRYWPMHLFLHVENHENNQPSRAPEWDLNPGMLRSRPPVPSILMLQRVQDKRSSRRCPCRLVGRYQTFRSDLLSPHSGSSETLVRSTRLQDLQYYLEQPWQISQQSVVVTESQIMATSTMPTVKLRAQASQPSPSEISQGTAPWTDSRPPKYTGAATRMKKHAQWETRTLIWLANHNTLPSCSAASTWYPPLQWILNTLGREIPETTHT
jgi:hypothetical protein